MNSWHVKEFHFHMRQSDNEQKTIDDGILYKKNKKPNKTILYFFNRECWHKKCFHSHLYYTKHIMILYYDITNVDPLKPKVMKLTYSRKVTFNINGRIIHFALAISLNKILTKLNALNDEKCDNFI